MDEPEETPQVQSCSASLSSLETRTKIIIGIIFLVLCVAVVVALSLALTSNGATCLPQSNLSRFSEAKNIAASDLKAMATFSGYLMIEDAIKGSQYLKLEHISTELVYYDAELQIETNCARIKLATLAKEDDYMIIIGYAEVFFGTPISDISSCFIKDLPNIQYEPHNHYSCSNICYYNCKADLEGSSIKSLTLAVRRLEFELNGNPNATKLGLYTTQPHRCAEDLE